MPVKFSPATARKRVSLRAPDVGGDDRYTVPVGEKDSLRPLSQILRVVVAG
jgi:hypothetical protein